MRTSLRLSCLALLFAGSVRADDSRRLFDSTPVSASNPVVATIDRSIEIPLSELKTYRDAERLRAITDPKSMAQRRALLDELINEYLLIDEAYRSGLATSPAFLRQMDATRTMMLTDHLAARASREPGATLTENPDAVAALGDRLFEEATIDISNEAYAIVKRGAKLLDKVRDTSALGPTLESPQDTQAKLRRIVESAPDAVLARYEGKSISVHQLLAIYAGLPAPRPCLEESAELIAMLKPLVVPELLAREAERRGIASEPAFQAQLTRNRNVLLRFRMQGLIEREANAHLAAADAGARLRAWYEAHKTDYAVATAAGATRIPAFDDMKARVEADYSVGVVEESKTGKVAALRAGREIAVDEAALARL